MQVALIDYGSGNLASAEKALARAAVETGHDVIVTSDPEAVRAAERIVLPGVGAFADCMRGLSSVPGMVEVLRANYIRTAHAKGAPTHRIIFAHALRAAILPLVSYLAPATAGLLTGSLIVEEIFGLPGIGRIDDNHRVSGRRIRREHEPQKFELLGISSLLWVGAQWERLSK